MDIRGFEFTGLLFRGQSINNKKSPQQVEGFLLHSAAVNGRNPGYQAVNNIMPAHFGTAIFFPVTRLQRTSRKFIYAG
jgi:hypothetical protein